MIKTKGDVFHLLYAFGQLYLQVYPEKTDIQGKRLSFLGKLVGKTAQIFVLSNYVFNRVQCTRLDNKLRKLSFQFHSGIKVD